MTTIKICDVCGNGIEPGEPTPVLTLPPEWLVLVNEDPASAPMDVCSTGCLHDAASGLANVLDKTEPANLDEEPAPDEEEHPLLPQAPTRLDNDLQPRYFGPGDAEGVQMRS